MEIVKRGWTVMPDQQPTSECVKCGTVARARIDETYYNPFVPCNPKEGQVQKYSYCPLCSEKITFIFKTHCPE